MRRELLLLEEMIDAAEQAHLLVDEVSAEQLADDRQRRDGFSAPGAGLAAGAA